MNRKSIVFGVHAAICVLGLLAGLALMWVALIALAIEFWPLLKYGMLLSLGAIVITVALRFWPVRIRPYRGSTR